MIQIKTVMNTCNLTYNILYMANGHPIGTHSNKHRVYYYYNTRWTRRGRHRLCGCSRGQMGVRCRWRAVNGRRRRNRYNLYWKTIDSDLLNNPTSTSPPPIARQLFATRSRLGELCNYPFLYYNSRVHVIILYVMCTSMFSISPRFP